MKRNNSKKTAEFTSKPIKSSFTGTQLTNYAGLSPIMNYLNKLNLGKELNDLFPTVMHNSTKFSNAQILLAIVLASFVGISRLIKIASFTCDSLVMALLGLQVGLNKDVIGVRLKQLEQAGAIKLQEYVFGLTTNFIEKCNLESITIDADSTVKTVYGNQQGAAKGYNGQKKGAKSYHPLLAFVTDMKIVVNSWFRTGSAYTSNGVCEFIKQTAAILPSMVTDVFFRADSGFFSGALFELLESLGWTYLVKVKLKNLNKLLATQTWNVLTDNPHIALCEFEYRAHGWGKSRKLKAIRTLIQWIEVDFMGQVQLVPQYEYACYCSNLALDGFGLHERYKERATSENWIEQVKNQLLAGSTITDNFHANDMLWQLSVLAYNLSVMMRYKVKKFWRQEHATFREWFINLPGKLVKGSRYLNMKIYKNYYLKDRWTEFEHLLSISN